MVDNTRGIFINELQEELMQKELELFAGGIELNKVSKIVKPEYVVAYNQNGGIGKI